MPKEIAPAATERKKKKRGKREEEKGVTEGARRKGGRGIFMEQT